MRAGRASHLGVGLEVSKLPGFTRLSKCGHGAFHTLKQLPVGGQRGGENPNGDSARPMPHARGRHALDRVHELERAPKSWRQRGASVGHRGAR